MEQPAQLIPMAQAIVQLMSEMEIHKVIALHYSGEYTVDDLKQMIQQVNSSQLGP